MPPIPSSNPVQQLTLKDRIWLFGTSAWIVGIIDRSIAIFSSGSLTAINIIQLLLAIVFFGGWLYLKPRSSSRTRLNSPMVRKRSRPEPKNSFSLESEQSSEQQADEAANSEPEKELSLCGTPDD
ncbi:hypothetical protein [Egbenema bharatensis]|uniref:hypothetical protein n=1 Tax=Egbenema bharatensis TaxID=3463334 RepID=UPI003A8AD717